MSNQEVHELHRLMGMLHSIDVGLVVLDRDYNIMVWNNFMTNRSGLRGEHVVGNNLFNMFPDLPEQWLKNKTRSVFLLKSRTFTSWEQRPYLFRFKGYRPITGSADFMYQNITFIPLTSADGTVEHLGLIIYDVTDVAVSKTELEVANKELEQLSRTDRLTRLNNRGYWEECLVREFKRAKRTQADISLLMFDIDHFKQVNDSFGHQAGDEVIRQVAKALQDTIRCTDIAGRYGGEEFGVILVDTPAANAKVLAERLRQRIEARMIRYDGMEITFTISIGIAVLSEDIENHTVWLEQSDRALYYCKEHGRNQVHVYTDKN